MKQLIISLKEIKPQEATTIQLKELLESFSTHWMPKPLEIIKNIYLGLKTQQKAKKKKRKEIIFAMLNLYKFNYSADTEQLTAKKKIINNN